jgi:hypothetical protein
LIRREVHRGGPLPKLVQVFDYFLGTPATYKARSTCFLSAILRHHNAKTSYLSVFY